MNNGWLTLNNAQRRTTLEQAAINSGIQTKAIEKDWWVTLSLRALFSTPYAPYCIFKGGTSLSKGWNLLQRLQISYTLRSLLSTVAQTLLRTLLSE